MVTASEITQKRRVLERKNMTEKDYELIKRNQLSETEKLKRADFILNTDKSLSDTKREVMNLYQRLEEMTD